jgi:CheY-like chemotaxis protein
MEKVDSRELNLLVVDDEEAIGRLLKRVLGRRWKSVTVAHSASEGVEVLKSGEYDVVLTDWDCPQQGNGYLVVQSTDLPIVIQTGSFGVTCPGVRVLSKPVDTEDINQALVEAYIQRRTECQEDTK